MRKHELDNLRWATVCLTVVYHALYLFNSVAPGGAGPLCLCQPWDAALYLLHPWIMQALFLAAGMSARLSLAARTGRAFLRERTRKLLVPSTLGVLALGWVQGAVNMALAGAPGALGDLPAPALWLILCLSGIGVLWFSQTLWLFSALLLPIRRLERGRLGALGGRATLPALVLLGVPVHLAGLVLNAPVVVVYRFGVYGLLFLLGYFVFSADAVMDRLARRCLPLCVAAAVAGVAFTALAFGRNYADAPVAHSPLASAYGWLACLAALGVARRYGRGAPPLALFMARRSFGLYTCHYLPMSALALALRGRGLPPLPCYLAVTAAGFGGGLLLAALLARVPVIRWLALGIKEVHRAQG